MTQRGMVRQAASLLVITAAVFSARAADFQGFVKVRPDRELYTEVTAAAPGRPTVILLNGMTYSTREWDPFHAQLRRRGFGIVRFDFDGMGRTLLRYAPSTALYPWETQTQDVKSLLTALGLRPPYHFVGLSYGGGVGIAYAHRYPREVGHLILMAPYTQALEGQDNWIRSQIWLNRRTFPTNPATDDELYDFFLRQLVYTTYPQAEPIVLRNPFQLEAVYNLTRGIRKLRAVDLAPNLPSGTVHLMTAAQDQYIPPGILESFWNQVAPGARASRIEIQQSEHKIPQAVPSFAAAWVTEILLGRTELRGGRSFQGYPHNMTASSGELVIPLNR